MWSLSEISADFGVYLSVNCFILREITAKCNNFAHTNVNFKGWADLFLARWRYISPTDTSSMQNLILKGLQKTLQKSCSQCNQTLGMSNQAIYYNLQIICFSSFIGLKTLAIMSPTIDAPYLWIRPLGSVPLNLAYGLLWIVMDCLYIPVIILHLSIVAIKHSNATITQLRSW